MEFEYDSAKSEANRAKHGIDFEQAAALWHDPKRVEFVARFSDESRLGVVAQLQGKLWTAIFTSRQGRIRLISVRRSRENEETIYHERPGI